LEATAATYYKKFGRICAACGTDQNITVHHMSYERLGHELDDDLLALCLDHHRLLHRLYPRTCPENAVLFLVDYQIKHSRISAISVPQVSQPIAITAL
jgi:hypothetical protein